MSGLCITWPYSIHIPVVEVDIETGTVKFLRYAIVHDCGVEINPMVVEGQVVGGTAKASAARCWRRWSTTRTANS